MAVDLTRRTYDLLRLIDSEEPIGSIRLVERMQHRGYSIKGRTVRVVLSELDEAGLTEKVPGKGRRLTAKGRAELARGNVSGRLRQPRERIATVTSQVTYDPVEDVGEVAAASATIPDERLEDGFDHSNDWTTRHSPRFSSRFRSRRTDGIDWSSRRAPR